MKKLNRSGFSVVEAFLIVILLGILVGTGLYVYHAQNNANKTLDTADKTAASQTQTIKKKSPTKTTKLTTTVLVNSKLSFSYDASAWSLSDVKSGNDDRCGIYDLATLTYKSTFALKIDMNSPSCGKGGGSCDDQLDTCRAEVQKLFEPVQLTASNSGTIAAGRHSYDAGKTWDQFKVFLTDKYDCNGDFCGITEPNTEMNEGSSTLIGEYINETAEPANLSAFVASDQVIAAETVLKSVHFVQ